MLHSHHAMVGSMLLRMLAMMDELGKLKEAMLEPKGDPDLVDRVFVALSDISKDVIHLEEVLMHSTEALKSLTLPRIKMDRGLTEKPPQTKVYELLNFKTLLFDLERRSVDVSKHLTALQSELWFVWRKSDDMYETRSSAIFKEVDVNTNRMLSCMYIGAKTNVEALRIVQQLLVASLVFGLGDRLVGKQWSVTGHSTVKEQWWGTAAMDQPFAWMLLGFVMWAAIYIYHRQRSQKVNFEVETGWMTSTISFNQAVNLDALDEFLGSRTIISETVEYTTDWTECRATWIEPWLSTLKWRGYTPRVTIEYDDENGFIFKATIKYHSLKGSMETQQLKALLVEILTEANVIADQTQEIEDDTEKLPQVI